MKNWKSYFLLALTACYSLTSYASAIRCEQLFATESKYVPFFGSPNWNRWISEKADKQPNPIYSANMYLGLSHVFQPWFQSSKSHSFQHMLGKMHQVATLGMPEIGGGGSYQTKTYQTQNIFPGKFRSQVVKLLAPESAEKKAFWDIARNDGYFEIPLTYFENSRFQYKALKEGALKSLPQIIQDFKDGSKTVRIELAEGLRRYYINAILIGKDGRTSGVYWSNQIPGTPSSEKWKENFAFAENSIHLNSGKYADWNGPLSINNYKAARANDLNFYLAHAEALMHDLKKNYNHHKPAIDLSKPLDSKQILLLGQLASYFQTLICAHPFISVNKSIFMNQVNFILSLNGFRPILHKELDYWAMTLDYSEFKRFFIEEVLEQQPL